MKNGGNIHSNHHTCQPMNFVLQEILVIFAGHEQKLQDTNIHIHVYKIMTVLHVHFSRLLCVADFALVTNASLISS